MSEVALGDLQAAATCSASQQDPHLYRPRKTRPTNHSRTDFSLAPAGTRGSDLPHVGYVRASTLWVVLIWGGDSGYRPGNVAYAYPEGVTDPLAQFVNEAAYQARKLCMQKCTEMVLATWL